MREDEVERITDPLNPNFNRVLVKDCPCENCNDARRGVDSPGFVGRENWEDSESMARFRHLQQMAAQDRAEGRHIDDLAADMRKRWANRA